MKSFSKWKIEEVEETFHLTICKKHPLLEQWMLMQEHATSEEQAQFAQLQERLLDNVWDWNEEELNVYFIIPLLEIVNFKEERYRPFLSRELSVRYHDETIAGSVDFMVASGVRSPKAPYFFLHEYKKEHDSSDDPLGQLMIAMVVAQLSNQDGHPVYGVYVMGRYWHFVVLDADGSYAVHTGLNACDEEIERIFGVLLNTKRILTEWTHQGV